MGHWSELPKDILVTIEELFELYIDKVRVRAVCMLWNSLLPKMPDHQVKQLPWLLQAFDKNTKASHGLFNISEKKFYHFNLPDLQGKLFKGSSHGWILTVQDIPNVYVDGAPTRSINKADIYIINPLTGVRIQLPPRYSFPDVEDFVADREFEYRLLDDDGGDSWYDDSQQVNTSSTYKLVLSTTPSSEDCVVVAIYGEHRKLAWCKCNDEKWTPLNLWNVSNCPIFEDVIFCKGKLHAVNCQGEVLVFENICVDPKATILVRETRHVLFPPLHLVEGSEGLLLVDREFHYVGADGEPFELGPMEYLPGDYSMYTITFRVFKLDSINSSWVEVKNIGDDILFLSLNSSFSISSRDFPGCQGNRIYFADSELSYQHRKEPTIATGVGVFNIEDGSFESLPGFECDVKFLWPPRVWVTRPCQY